MPTTLVKILPAWPPLRRVRGTALVFAMLWLFPAVAPAEDPEDGCNQAPMVVKIHADWCQSCRRVQLVWSQLGAELGGKIILVELDVTDRTAFEKSMATADKLGLKEFFAKYRSQTGTVAILDCNSLEPVAILAGEQDPSKYREAIAKAAHAS